MVEPGKSGLKQMGKILDYLFNRPETDPFREPVDWKALRLYDYPQVITRPIDLGTIRQRLDEGKYRCAAECATDIRLVWENCKTYNRENSEFFHLANTLSKKFEDRYAKVADKGEADRSGGTGGGYDEAGGDAISAITVTTDEKVQFSNNLYRLGREDMGQVLLKIDQRCPEAIERMMEDEVQLNVDVIDTRVFLELSAIVINMISEASAAQAAAAAGSSKKQRRS